MILGGVKLHKARIKYLNWMKGFQISREVGEAGTAQYVASGTTYPYCLLILTGIYAVSVSHV